MDVWIINYFPLMRNGTLSLLRQIQIPGIYVAYTDTLLANETETTLWAKH